MEFGLDPCLPQSAGVGDSFVPDELGGPYVDEGQWEVGEISGSGRGGGRADAGSSAFGAEERDPAVVVGVIGHRAQEHLREQQGVARRDAGAGRECGQDEPVGIDAELLAVRSGPRQTRVRVLDGSWVGMLGGQAVSRGDKDDSLVLDLVEGLVEEGEPFSEDHPATVEVVEARPKFR